MSLYFWIFIGSGLGGLARFALAGLIAQRFGETLPRFPLLAGIVGSGSKKIQVSHQRYEHGARKWEGAES